MSVADRIESLKTRHNSLENRIHAEGVRPSPDQTTVARLKREKLRVKDELERLGRD
ncbi:MAG: YdcH family protein [Gluconacetobacter diazotrophicus]|nr:YdcH family protein [Gluconacetobacter diazotrophicus]